MLLCEAHAHYSPLACSCLRRTELQISRLRRGGEDAVPQAEVPTNHKYSALCSLMKILITLPCLALGVLSILEYFIEEKGADR